MTRTYQPWTAKQRDEAFALRDAGMTQKDIGARFGRSARAVQQFFANERGVFNRLGRVCSDCPSAIKDANKTGRCKVCNTRAQNKDAAFVANRVEALRASGTLAPGAPAAHQRAKNAAATRMKNPAYVAWLREHMRTVVSPTSHTPEAQAKRDYAEVGRKIREHRLGWCPEEYRAEYRALIRSKGYPMAEAKAMIRAQIAADKPKPAQLSPFERQMLALERGAQIVANDRIVPVEVHSLLAERAA